MPSAYACGKIGLSELAFVVSAAARDHLQAIAQTSHACGVMLALLDHLALRQIGQHPCIASIAREWVYADRTAADQA